ncbi:MAG TPA: DUF2934 domain-containing protein [Planctomycetota bacterium]|nr:DUF2934 domain-containing protein [Planctomycetota bacterium]
MSHRRAPSSRSFARGGHAAYRGTERRNPANPLYVGCDRRMNNRRESNRSAASRAGSRQPATVRPAPEMPAFLPPTEEQVAALARELFVESGCVPGKDVENWLEAEARLWLKAKQASMELQRRLWEDYRLALEQDLLEDPEQYDERLWMSRIHRHEPPDKPSQSDL